MPETGHYDTFVCFYHRGVFFFLFATDYISFGTREIQLALLAQVCRPIAFS